jgi:hypothetical protein
MKPDKNARRNAAGGAPLVEFDEEELTFEQVYAESDEVGRELMDISLGMPDTPGSFTTLEEVEAEIARRRGGLGDR